MTSDTLSHLRCSNLCQVARLLLAKVRLLKALTESPRPLLISAVNLYETATGVAGPDRAEAMSCRSLDVFGIVVASFDTPDAVLSTRLTGSGARDCTLSGLNVGDCPAYALSQIKAALLYVGNDFSQTDVRPAVDAGPAIDAQTM